MHKIGNLLGVLGIAVCVLAAAGRFVNEPYIYNFQAINIYIVGLGAALPR